MNRREAEADRRQAEYYLRVLNSSLGDSDRRIVKYQCALALYEARGNAEEARRVRRTIRVEQRDRHTLEQMIDNLQRRYPTFGRGHPARVPPDQQRAGLEAAASRSIMSISYPPSPLH